MFGINLKAVPLAGEALGAYRDLKSSVTAAFRTFENQVKVSARDDNRRLAQADLGEATVVADAVHNLVPYANPDNMYENIDNITFDTMLSRDLIEPDISLVRDYVSQRSGISRKNVNKAFQSDNIASFVRGLPEKLANFEDRRLAQELTDSSHSVLARLGAVEEAAYSTLLTGNYLSVSDSITTNPNKGQQRTERNVAELRSDLKHMAGLIERAQEASIPEATDIKDQFLESLRPYTQAAVKLLAKTNGVQASVAI